MRLLAHSPMLQDGQFIITNRDRQSDHLFTIRAHGHAWTRDCILKQNEITADMYLEMAEYYIPAQFDNDIVIDDECRHKRAVIALFKGRAGWVTG